MMNATPIQNIQDMLVSFRMNGVPQTVHALVEFTLLLGVRVGLLLFIAYLRLKVRGPSLRDISL